MNIKKIAEKIFDEEINKCSDETKSIINGYKIKIINYLQEIVYVRKFPSAINNELLFYKEMAGIFRKIEKTYEKFLLFCDSYQTVLGDGKQFRETIIDIMTDDQNFQHRFGATMSMQMGLNSAISDLYMLMRMFVLFDKKEREPIKCSDTITPLNIIIYAGSSHTLLYRSVLNYFNIPSVAEIYDAESLKTKSNTIREKIHKNTKKINLNNKYVIGDQQIALRNAVIEQTNIELQQRIKEIDLMVSKLSDRYVDLKNADSTLDPTVNSLVTHFLTEI
jgi:hypothetical protein